MLLRPPVPASCLLLISGGSEPPEDDTGKPTDRTGEDPNLKKEVAEDEDATTVEELLLLDAIVAGVIAPMLVEFPAALTPLLGAADDELLSIFDTGGGKEENEGLEKRDPLF